MGNLLNVKNLTVIIEKENRSLNAVDGISFSIEEGEILGIAGESGCGKSMITHSIPGLLPKRARIGGGEIIYKNQSLTNLHEDEMRHIRKKEISVIFQDYRHSLNPLIKAGRQITETLELGGSFDRKKNKRRTIEILFRLGFDEPKKSYNAYPHQLSGGMCPPVMAAIAAISRPRLLLADEPTTALDSDSQKKILSLLSELNRKEGTSIIIISHDLSVIQDFCSRYLIMYAGKIIEEGPSYNLLSPLHPYTKALAAAVPSKEKRGKDLETITGKVPSIEDTLSGCPFAPRCKKAQKQCFKEFPPPVVSPKINQRSDTSCPSNNYNRASSSAILDRTAKLDSVVYCYFPETVNG
jgi:peptide/nickel transport system ATP-binding protein